VLTYRSVLKLLKLPFSAAVAVMGLAFPLAAVPITYTMTGTFSGTLGGDSATNASFTFVFYSDTGNIGNLSPTFPFTQPTSTSLLVTGFGTGQFSQVLDVALDQLSDVAGFGDPSSTNKLLIQSASFAGWNFATSIGPVLQPGTPFQVQGSFSTSLGTLVMTGAQNVTFGATVSTAPEPATWPLAVVSILSVVRLRRHRRRLSTLYP